MLHNRALLVTHSLFACVISEFTDTTERCFPLNRFNLSQTLTFRSAVPQTFRVFQLDLFALCALLKSPLSLEYSVLYLLVRLPSKELNDLLHMKHSIQGSVNLCP